MRPGQGQRRGGRRNENRHGGGGQHRSSQGGQAQGQNRSATSLRNQIFDSNGPDMRVRGNAFQVHEKYQALAKDALSSGDRVLAENYQQHAEHYFRIIEAINEATEAEQRARQASWESQPQPSAGFTDVPTEQPNQQPQQDFSGEGQTQQSAPNPYQNNPRRDRFRDRDQNRDQNRESREQQFQARQQRFDGRNQEGRNNDQRNNDQRGNNYADGNRSYGQQHAQAEYQPHNPTQQNQSAPQDPLYDGVDEDVGGPDSQAAIGGRR